MNIALILSGGIGTRLGTDIPKQYIKINNRLIISYCIKQLSQHKEIDAIQIVAAEQWYDTILNCLKEYDGIQSGNKRKFRGFSQSGKTRQLSIFNGLIDICSYGQESDIILIHDAARPLLSMQLITNCLKTARLHDGVLPVLPMKDTIYESANGTSISTLLKRDKIYAGQAPEAFRFGLYLEANKALFPDKIFEINGSTEPAILAGMDIAMIAGEEENFKITTKEDLERFQKIISERM